MLLTSFGTMWGGGAGEVPGGRRTEEPKWRNPLSSEGRGLDPQPQAQPVPLHLYAKETTGPSAQEGGMQTLSEVRVQADPPPLRRA